MRNCSQRRFVKVYGDRGLLHHLGLALHSYFPLFNEPVDEKFISEKVEWWRIYLYPVVRGKPFFFQMT